MFMPLGLIAATLPMAANLGQAAVGNKLNLVPLHLNC